MSFKINENSKNLLIAYNQPLANIKSLCIREQESEENNPAAVLL